MTSDWYAVLETLRGRWVLCSREAIAAELREYGQRAISVDALASVFDVFPGSKIESVRELGK